MRLSEDFLLNIKESNDIYDVISSYVPLKKSGTDSATAPSTRKKHRPVIYTWPRRAFTASAAERQAML
mgnify:CR=1 FL=1